MNVKLIAHSTVSEDFISELPPAIAMNYDVTDGQMIALSAIRTCYSPGKPSEIVAKEGAKYFGNKATDGEVGTEADRLFRMIVRSGHTSTLEHISFTFAIEGVSRALLAQLTRHRVGFSYSVQSQRYVKFSSGSRSGGIECVTPESVATRTKTVKHTTQFGREVDLTAEEIFERAVGEAQYAYDKLVEAGVPQEDARAVLPQATAVNLVMTANLRALLDFYGKRRKGNGAQHEITELAERLKDAVVAVEPWTAQFFEGETK